MGRILCCIALACVAAAPAFADDRVGDAYRGCEAAPAGDEGFRYSVSDNNAAGFIPLPSGGCLRLGGSATASFGSLFYREIFDRDADRSNGTSIAAGGTLDVSTRQRYERFDVTTNVTVESSGSDLVLNRATINVGPFSFGRRSSFFDYWEPTDFLFTDLIPSKYPKVAAYTLRLLPNVRVSIAAESPQTRFVVSDGYGPVSVPDVVARLRVKTAFAILQASVAVRHVRFARDPFAALPGPDGDGDGGSAGGGDDGGGVSALTPLSRAQRRNSANGYAVQIAGTIPLPFLGPKDEFVMEADYARNAPGYLGVSNPDDAVGYVIPSTFTAREAEISRGYSVSAMLTHAWSETWRSNAFVTFLALRLGQPEIEQLRIVRSAVNLIWSPVKDLDIGIETNRLQALVPRGSVLQNELVSRDQWTFQGTIRRAF